MATLVSEIFFVFVETRLASFFISVVLYYKVAFQSVSFYTVYTSYKYEKKTAPTAIIRTT